MDLNPNRKELVTLVTLHEWVVYFARPAFIVACRVHSWIGGFGDFSSLQPTWHLLAPWKLDNREGSSKSVLAWFLHVLWPKRVSFQGLYSSVITGLDLGGTLHFSNLRIRGKRQALASSPMEINTHGVPWEPMYFRRLTLIRMLTSLLCQAWL